MKESFGKRIDAIAAIIKRDGRRPVYREHGREPYSDICFNRWLHIEGQRFVRFIPYTEKLSEELPHRDGGDESGGGAMIDLPKHQVTEI